MPPFGRDDSTIVDELLQQGLTFFAANRVEQAVARWRQVLEISPGEPRALDYLASAGHPFAEGTGQSGTPVGPSTRAPDTGEIEVFEIAPISHRTDWPRHVSMVQAKAGPSRASILAPWLLIAVLVPVVSYLVYSQLGGRSEPAPRTAKSVERAQPALSVPPASHPAPVVAKTAPAPAAAPQVVPAPAARPADDTYVVTLSVVPPTAIIKVDGQQVARGEYIARLRRDGVAHTVEISAPRYQTRELTFVDQAPPERVRLLPDRAARRARRAQREARREAGGRSEDRGADKGADRADDKAAPAEAAKPVDQAQPEPPKAAAPARKSDNINPWSSTR
jgi:hypothetical protein